MRLRSSADGEVNELPYVVFCFFFAAARRVARQLCCCFSSLTSRLYPSRQFCACGSIRAQPLFLPVRGLWGAKRHFRAELRDLGRVLFTAVFTPLAVENGRFFLDLFPFCFSFSTADTQTYAGLRMTAAHSQLQDVEQGGARTCALGIQSSIHVR